MNPTTIGNVNPNLIKISDSISLDSSEVVATSKAVKTVKDTADTALAYADAARTTANEAKALDANCVHKTGDEEISGTKTFSNIFVKKDPSRTDAVHLWTDQEGGNVRLVKGSGHLEIDTLTLDEEGGYGRIFIGDSNEGVKNAIFLEKSGTIGLYSNILRIGKENIVYLGNTDNSFNMDTMDGPVLALRKSNFVNPYSFDLIARGGGKECSLSGNPDGYLEWNRRAVLTMPKYGSQVYGTWYLQENTQEQIYNYTPSVPCMFVYYATVYRNVQWAILLRKEDPNAYEVAIGNAGQDMPGNTFKQTITGFCPAGVTIRCVANTYNTGGPGGGYIEYRYYPLV